MSSVFLLPCLRIVEVPVVMSVLGITPLNEPKELQGVLNV
jgi:hypothetical protein